MITCQEHDLWPVWDYLNFLLQYSGCHPCPEVCDTCGFLILDLVSLHSFAAYENKCMWLRAYFVPPGCAGPWEVLPPVLLPLHRLQTEPGGSAVCCRLTRQGLLRQRLPQVSFELLQHNKAFKSHRQKDQTQACQTGYSRHTVSHTLVFMVSGSRLPAVLPADHWYCQQRWPAAKWNKFLRKVCDGFRLFQGSTESIRVVSFNRNYHVKCWSEANLMRTGADWRPPAGLSL